MATEAIIHDISGAVLLFTERMEEILHSAESHSEVEDAGSLLIDDLMSFFPVDKIDLNAGTYDQYLFDLRKTVTDNYGSGNFQVAYFYAHLIFMSYVYYCTERAYQIQPDRMKDVFYPINAYSGRNDKPDIENYKSIYEFSKIPEKEIFKVFRIMGMEHSQIRDLSKYISDRDDYAHATGKGNISIEALFQNVRAIIGNMETLSDLFKPSCKERYVKYLLENADNPFDTISETAYDYILDNGLSQRDINYICTIGISNIRDDNAEFREKYRLVKRVHCAFIEYCIENMSIEEPENYTSLRDLAYLNYRYKGNAKGFVENELGINEFQCVKDGGTFPVFECPECGEEQLAYDAETHRYHCFACDENYTDDDLAFCDRCGSLMRRDGEQTICQSCIENMTKD